MPSGSGHIWTPRSRWACVARSFAAAGSAVSTARRVAARSCPGVCCRALASTFASTCAVCLSERFMVSVSMMRALARVIRPASSAAKVPGNWVQSESASFTRDTAVRDETRSINPTSATAASCAREL